MKARSWLMSPLSVSCGLGIFVSLFLCAHTIWAQSRIDRLKAATTARAMGSRLIRADRIEAQTIVARSPDGDREIVLHASNDAATIKIDGPEGQTWVVVTKDRRGLYVNGRNEGVEVRIGTKTGGAPGVIVYEMGGEREEHFGTEPPRTLRSTPKPRPKDSHPQAGTATPFVSPITGKTYRIIHTDETDRPEERALCQSIPSFPCKCGCADPEKPCHCDHTKNVNPESPDPKVRGDVVSPRD